MVDVHPQVPRTPQKTRPLHRSNSSNSGPHTYGTPRRRKVPSSARLQGIKNTVKTIPELTNKLCSALNLLFTPDPWQVHLISRIQQGYDSVFLAGTGYGKSLIFEGLAALGGAKKGVVIISPLKALERLIERDMSHILYDFDQVFSGCDA